MGLDRTRGRLKGGVLSLLAQQASLLLNAGSLLGATVITSLLGVAYWGLAARTFSEDAVGVASAAVGAMSLIGFFATLGLGTLLMGELPRLQRGHHSLINAALLTTTAVGAVLGALFAVVAPLLSSEFDALNADPLAILAFAASVGLTALSLVLDQALLGLLRGDLQLTRNTVFAVVKLLALVPIGLLIADAGPVWIYAAWGFGILASLVVLVPMIRQRSDSALRPDFSLLSGMRVSAASHHAFNMALQIPSMAMPVLVVGLVSASANAVFYVAWMIASLLLMVPVSLGTVLYPISTGNPAGMRQGLRTTLVIALAFGLLANLFLLPAASPILEIFGPSYAEQGTATLHILALGVFPLTFKTLYVAIHRVQRKLGRSLPVVWVGTILELLGAFLGATFGDGLTGVSWGWLAAVLIEGLLMGGDVVRNIRRPPRAEDRAAEPGVADRGAVAS